MISDAGFSWLIKNMNKKNIIWIVLIVLVFIIIVTSFYYFGRQKQPQISSVSAETSTNVVTYYCKEGVIIASYGKSSVRLALKDGRAVTLPQTMSGSGIRYELGPITFGSKGDNASLTENNIDTYTNCVAGTETTSGDINTYIDYSKTFSFSYPNQLTLSGGDIGYSPDWRENATSLGFLLAVVNVPKSFLPNTNFGEAKFTIGTSVSPEAIKNCLVADNGGVNHGTIIIGSNEVTKVTSTDVGAGQHYDTTSYRTIYNNQCYAIEYTIHSSNIDNYPPDQGIKEFDKSKIDGIFEDMVQSFKFTQLNSTVNSYYY